MSGNTGGTTHSVQRSATHAHETDLVPDPTWLSPRRLEISSSSATEAEEGLEFKVSDLTWQIA
jgi:hypothetical protein